MKKLIALTFLCLAGAAYGAGVTPLTNAAISGNSTLGGPLTLSGSGSIVGGTGNFVTLQIGGVNLGSLFGTFAQGALASTALQPTGNGSGLTSLNASNLGSGTVPAARGGAGTNSGILKADGAGNVSAASAGTDYLAPGGNINGYTRVIAQGTGVNVLGISDLSGVGWQISTGPESTPDLYIGGAAITANYFWRANWNTTGQPCDTFRIANSSMTGLTTVGVQAVTSQTGDLQDWLASNGTTVLAKVDINGNITGNTVASSGAVTGASAAITNKLTSGQFVLGTGPDLSLEPIVGGQSAVTTWWGLQLCGNRQSSPDYTPVTYGTAGQFGVVIPSQQTGVTSVAVIRKASQTGDLQDWDNESLATLAKVDANGNFTAPSFTGTHSGNGVGLTSLNASNISSGVVGATYGGAGTNNGILKGNGSGTVSTAAAGTDYLSPSGSGAALTSLNASNLGSGTVPAARGGAGSSNGILKADGSGNVSAASAGTDYVTPTGSGASLTSLNANNISSGVVPATNGGAGASSGLLKANGAGVVSAASGTTDYVPPARLPGIRLGTWQPGWQPDPVVSATVATGVGSYGAQPNGCFDGTYIWIPFYASGATLSRINVTTNAVTNITVPLSKTPTGCCYDGSSVFVSSNQSSPYVFRFNASTGVCSGTLSVPGTTDTYGMVSDGAGSVYFLNASWIFRASTSSFVVTGSTAAPGNGYTAWGCTVAGNMYFSGANKVMVFNLASMAITGTITTVGTPGSMATDGLNIWATTGATNTILVISPATQTVITTIPLGGTANGITFDGVNMWAGGGTNVYRIPVACGGLKAYAVPSAVSCMNFDGFNVWATMSNGSIVKYTLP